MTGVGPVAWARIVATENGAEGAESLARGRQNGHPRTGRNAVQGIFTGAQRLRFRGFCFFAGAGVAAAALGGWLKKSRTSAVASGFLVGGTQ